MASYDASLSAIDSDGNVYTAFRNNGTWTHGKVSATKNDLNEKFTDVTTEKTGQIILTTSDTMQELHYIIEKDGVVKHALLQFLVDEDIIRYRKAENENWRLIGDLAIKSDLNQDDLISTSISTNGTFTVDVSKYKRINCVVNCGFDTNLAEQIIITIPIPLSNLNYKDTFTSTYYTNANYFACPRIEFGSISSNIATFTFKATLGQYMESTPYLVHIYGEKI